MSKVTKADATAQTQAPTEEQTANINALNAAQTATVELKAEPTEADLKQAVIDAGGEYTQALMGADNAKQAEAGKKFMAAKRSLDEFTNKIAAKQAEEDAKAKLAAAYDVVTSTLGVTRETLEGIVKQFTPANDADDAAKKTAAELAHSFRTVFGNKPIIAREGQTGANLASGERKKGTGTEILALWNDGNGLTPAQIIEKGYSRGTTHAVILERKRELGIAPAKA